ncbi:MAG TPA: 4Fe-4S binding protein [Candidatus Lokiarchaeia archaeon]|nr:4Fe-4S binding protein [Candidatus Lokiarchaeia archaeon]
MARKFKLPMMLKEVILNLFRSPATQKYPAVRPEIPEGFRGRQIFHIDLCVSCGLCAKDCPAKAIEMVDVEGYEKKKPLFMLDRCVFCYQCADGCPKNAIEPSGFFEMAAITKSDLVVKPQAETPKRSDETNGN